MKRLATAREKIVTMIVIVRGQRAILDADIAKLYSVSTSALMQAVRRNRNRFPADFMIRLTKSEFANLRSQNVISSSWGGRRTPPYAFTELGVAMLSSALRSKRAIAANIEIMRAFVELRRMLSENRELARRIDELEKRYDSNFEIVFDAIRKLIAPAPQPRKRIGYLSAGES